MAAIVGKEARCRPQYIGRVPSTSRRTTHSVRVEENMGSSFSEVSLVVFSLLCSSSKPELSSKNPDAESSLGMDLVSPFSSFCHYCANFLKEESSLKLPHMPPRMAEIIAQLQVGDHGIFVQCPSKDYHALD
jgi:hypothetical protein